MAKRFTATEKWDDPWFRYSIKGQSILKEARRKAFRFTDRKSTRQLAFKMYGEICKKCGATENLHLDHIIPIAFGGKPENIKNIQILCKKCNLKKGGRIE